ncbi:MAG TPA: hypothetical protein VNV62_18610 [Trebonia sp.]|nr:hypothetical protein [Trebonia sp.]
MQLGATDAELEAIGREIHGMWHAGATEADGLTRLRARLSNGRYDKLPRLLRPVFNRVTRTVLASMWGPDHCGPDHEIVICDEPADV